MSFIVLELYQRVLMLETREISWSNPLPLPFKEACNCLLLVVPKEEPFCPLGKLEICLVSTLGKGKGHWHLGGEAKVAAKYPLMNVTATHQKEVSSCRCQQCRGWEALVYWNCPSLIQTTKANFAFGLGLFHNILPADILPRLTYPVRFETSGFLASCPPPPLDFGICPLSTSSVNNVTSPTTASFSHPQPTHGVNHLLLPMMLWLLHVHFIHLMHKYGGND